MLTIRKHANHNPKPKRSHRINTRDVADKLVELCRQGQYKQAQDELYADHAVSIEPEGSMWKSAEGFLP